MASHNVSGQGTRWYQFRIRDLLLAAILISLMAAAWHQALQVARLTEDIDRLKQGHSLSGEALRLTGIASGSVIRRDAQGKPSYLDAYGSKVEVYETFVLVYLVDRNSPEMPVRSVQFIPRDQLIDVSFKPPKL
jgi:hypothetical protein